MNECRECGKPEVVARGYCYACYRRWRRRDPVMGAREREQSRAYKARNRERMRQYNLAYDRDPAHRAVCSECGDLMGVGVGRPGDRDLASEPRCSDCRAHARARRGVQIERWWAEGLSLNEIASRLGWTRSHVGAQITYLRADGYDLPYRRARVNPKHPELAA